MGQTVMQKIILVTLCFLLLLAGCQSSRIATPAGAANPSPADTSGVEIPSQATIALVMKTLTNPFFVEMEKGARQAEKELGIHLIVKTAAQETSIEQQIQIVDELIAAKVDAIVIAPGDSMELIPVLKKAQDAGIIVVNIDNRLDPALSKKLGLVNVPFISVDNEQGAYLSAKYLSDPVKTPTQAVILEGIRTAFNADQRLKGAERAFAENKNVTLVATETANWKIDEAYTVTKSLFEEHPDIGLIFCANDMMALGAIEYLQESGRTQVRVAAYDALDEAKQAIRDGKLVATIDQQAARQGYLGIQYAVKMVHREQPPMLTLIDVLLVTAEDLQ